MRNVFRMVTRFALASLHYTEFSIEVRVIAVFIAHIFRFFWNFRDDKVLGKLCIPELASREEHQAVVSHNLIADDSYKAECCTARRFLIVKERVSLVRKELVVNTDVEQVGKVDCKV